MPNLKTFVPKYKFVPRTSCAHCGSSVPDGDQNIEGMWRCNMCLQHSEALVRVPAGPLLWRLLLAGCSNLSARFRNTSEAITDWMRIQEINDQLALIEEERRPYGGLVPITINSSTLPRRALLNQEISFLYSRRVLRIAHRYTIKTDPEEAGCKWDNEYQGWILTQDEYRRLRTLIRTERREQFRVMMLVWAPILTFFGTLLSVYLGWRWRR
jgi:hypothetical protein